MARLKYEGLTSAILNIFYKKVYHNLGYGFLENGYENAMAFELQRHGLLVERQYKVNVYYEGMVVGQYAADLVVDKKVILELKAVSMLTAQMKHSC